MPARASVIIVAATVLTAVGCGSQTPTPRARVAAYLNKANAIERQLQAPIQVVDKGLTASALPQTGGAIAAARERQQSLLGASRTITSLRARLAALDTPAPASRLRAILLELIDGQASLTLQTARLVLYVPAFQAALRPLAPGTKKLQGVLGQTHVSSAAALTALYAQKAAALRSFRATTDGVAAHLRRLAPPAILQASYRTELRALTGMGGAADELAGALTAGQTARIPSLLSAFDRAAAAPATTSSQRAERAAIIAYNRQIAQLSQLEVSAAQERLQLTNTLQ